MNQKIKTIILVVLIFIATVVLGVYIFKKNKSNQVVKEVSLIQTAVESEQPAPEEQIVEVVRENVTFPTAISGKLVGIDEKSWIINQPKGALEVRVNPSTPIFKKDGEKKVKITFGDIMPGTEVSVKLDKKTGDVLEAVFAK